MDAMGVVRIDRRWLRQRLACKPQVKLFAETFPDGCELSRANLMAAGRAGLDVDWLAHEILSPPAFRAYVAARAPARRAYEEAIAPAWHAYIEAVEPEPRAHMEARARAWRAFQAARAPAWRAYMEAVAPALADALDLD